MELIQATKEFLIDGQSYPGFPLLLMDSMESCVPANEFIRYYLLRGSIGSHRSWPSTGRAMYDFFSFVQSHELSWRDVDLGQGSSLVSAYRDYSLDTIKLGRNTVRQRLIYICAFYQYALRKRWIETLPFDYEDRAVRRDGDFLAHVDASGGKTKVRDVTPKKDRRPIKFLDKSQVRSLLAAAINPHHKMMVRVSLQTGLRRDEIATFPTAYVVNPDRRASTARNIRIQLDPRDGHGMRTKGSKARDIYVSRDLMRDMYFYCKHVRGERASLSSEPRQQLFLSQRGEPFAGDGKGFERIVRDIGSSVGIDVHPHMLRHTYATHTLYAMQRAESGIEPLVFVQGQLGHASILTTMAYLHLVHKLADEAVLAYDDEINGWFE